GAPAPLLGQLRRSAHPRRPARAAPADHLPGAGRRALAAAREPAPSARAEGIPEPSPARHDAVSAGRHRLDNQRRRTSGGRRRLRLRDVRRLSARGRKRGVGEATHAAPRGGPRVQAVVGLSVARGWRAGRGPTTTRHALALTQCGWAPSFAAASVDAWRERVVGPLPARHPRTTLGRETAWALSRA